MQGKEIICNMVACHSDLSPSSVDPTVVAQQGPLFKLAIFGVGTEPGWTVMSAK